eukprot:SAG31_NODE_83_length_27039_cov_14.035746_10_plen_183_part_00
MHCPYVNFSVARAILTGNCSSGNSGRYRILRSARRSASSARCSAAIRARRSSYATISHNYIQFSSKIELTNHRGMWVSLTAHGLVELLLQIFRFLPWTPAWHRTAPFLLCRGHQVCRSPLIRDRCRLGTAWLGVALLGPRLRVPAGARSLRRDASQRCRSARLCGCAAAMFVARRWFLHRLR